jgi:hypothetical protein
MLQTAILINHLLLLQIGAECLDDGNKMGNNKNYFNLNSLPSVKKVMKDTGALIIGLSHELSVYLKEHPGELPRGIDKDTLWVTCSHYVIDNIENYIFSPYKDKFLWRVKFKNSKYQEFEYMYFITYKAICNGEAGIVKAELMNEIRELSDLAHLSN